MKTICLILSLLFSFTTFSQSEFVLKDVKVLCQVSQFCKQRTLRFNNLKGEYRSLVHLKETLRVLASDGGYKSFSYEIIQIDGGYQLSVNMQLKPIIREINIGFTDRNIELDPSQLLSVKEGEFFESQKLQNDLQILPKRLDSLGFPANSHQLLLTEEPDSVVVNLAVTLGKPRVFNKIKTNAKSSFVNDFLTKKFYNQYNKPFELTKFKIYLDDAQKELFNYGYYLIALDFNPIIKNNRVTLDIKVSNDKLFTFDFVDLKQESREDLLAIIKELFKKYKRPLSEGAIKAALEEHFRKKALLNTSMDIRLSHFKNMYKEEVTLYRIHFSEKYKTQLKILNFIGNSFFSRNQLIGFYDKEAFELASLGFYDEEYLNYYAGLLRLKYVEQGYVQIKIIGPTTIFDSEKKTASVDFILQEGQRAFTRTLVFEGLPAEIEQQVVDKMTNKAGNPFDPIAMTEDLKTVATTMQEKGYYFAEVINANDDSLVQYSKNGADVDIKFVVNSGPLVRLNRVIYLGNNKTRKKVLEKKILLEKGDIVTPSRTRDFEASLSATGLFNSVSVQPLRHSSKNASTDLIVKVVEREYGLVEFAPGYRTDIGIKLSGTVSYMNIGGMNRSLALRGQVNQRLNFQTFDERRRKERKQLLEFNTSLNYTEGDIFDSLVDLGMGISFQRRRFFSFDADIARYNATLTRDLSKNLSSSVRYQLENISQSDATEERDNGTFRIGAITPSLTWDLRNSQINPVKGAFFNLSCEFANPYFLSQQKDDLTINYFKLVSRNRFYIPYKFGTVAISMVAGVQENLSKGIVRDGNGNVVLDEDGSPATEGYIPNIKVFRLTGMDIVRGFNDEEINRLINGDDIGEARVTDKAYLANFKLEPRYFINDALMAGIFLDAGRVYVDQFDFNKLRTSTGITFKVLTPVGTLDFDYGIKLDRQRVDGDLEDAGRFHVSIGFF